MPQTVADPDLTRLVMTVVQAGDAPGGGGQLPEFPGGGGGGQGAGPPPTLLPSQRSFHPLPATECHRPAGLQNKKSVFRIHRIHMFFGHPDPFVRSAVSIRIRILLSSSKIVRKTLIPTVL